MWPFDNARLDIIDAKLTQLAGVVNLIERQVVKMSAVIDNLTQKVNNAITVEQSAITLISGISQQVKDLAAQLAAAGVDVTAINQLAADLDAKTTDLAAAVTANTPASP